MGGSFLFLIALIVTAEGFSEGFNKPKTYQMFMKNLIKLNSPQSTQHNRQQSLFDLKAELAQLPRAQEPVTFRTCSLILAKYFSRVADDDSAIDILHSLEADEEVACELGFAHVRKGEWHAAINAFQSVQPPTYLTTYHTVLTSMKGSLDPCEYVEPLVKPTATRKILPTMNLECPDVESLLALHTRCEAKMREASVPGSILFPSLLLGRREVNWFDENVLLRLASINQLPVDGRQHLAVREKLDDKVGLHNLMGGSNFVPRGFVIGGEGSSSVTFCNADERRDWVVKDPKGWGGFGLTFFENMNIDEVVSSGRQDNGRPRSSSRTPLVAQEIVRSALVDGRCFSIRLFVILRDGGVFYTRNCLMKLSREGEKISNSAWNAIEGEEGQKEGWSILRGRVDELEGLLRDVFGRLKDEGDLEALTQCIVPKVLGFDLMLSEEGELKLIECNGTPGLIARSTDGVEFQVKKTVLEEAWGREDGGLVKLGVA